MERFISRSLVIAALIGLSSLTARGAEVKGRVSMPDTCSPTVSPSVVTLEPVGVSAPVAKGSTAVSLVNQHGLQFEPRVQVASVGQPIRFTNQDAETHNVHILTPGFPFNESMAPNKTKDFTPTKAGVVRLCCDVHTHMRGYVVVTASPWAKVTRPDGSFRFADVPNGSYNLVAWHEMGEPLRKTIEVKDGTLDLGTLTLTSYPIDPAVARSGPIRAWPEVIDRIGMLLSEARAVVGKPGGIKKARKLAEDAYWVEFEASEMEIAVRRHLGYKRAGEIEGQFRTDIRAAIKEVGEGKADASVLVTRSRQLLIDLAKASGDLKRLGINDRKDIAKPSGSTEVLSVPGSSERAEQLVALAKSFEGVKALANSGRASDAASGMTDAYFSDFEPLERLLNVRRPQEVAPLEARFNAIRGRIDAGLKASPLADDLDALRAEVAAAIDRANLDAAGSFTPAFAASLITILREGVEVILLLTMLVALATKAGQARALAAIWWGVGVAVVASLATAVGLNRVVASAQGRTQEMVEGAVMMAAAGVLFYVSYWLISQSQSKKWTEFLKGQVAHAGKAGGLLTLAVTAFLAVYREGAETALMYQAMISGQNGSRDGLVGLAMGLVLGSVLLTVIAVVIRSSSVRLPLRTFFKVTGMVLFAMAVVFAGNGVFELQSAGIIKVSPVGWLGLGVPVLGIHPSTQALSVQGMLVAGAVLALALPMFETKVKASTPRPTASVGA